MTCSMIMCSRAKNGIFYDCAQGSGKTYAMTTCSRVKYDIFYESVPKSRV